MIKDKKLRPLLLAISILLGFVLLVMFTLIQIAQRYSIMYTCGCAYSLPIIIVLLSGTGLVAGILTYYFLTKTLEQKKINFLKNREQVLKFLETDEKLVMQQLIKNNGSITQNILDKKLKMDRVKIFRVIEKLEKKQIVTKQKTGKTNKIILVQELQEAFL